MNAYLFSAGCTTSQVLATPGRGGQMIESLHSWDNCGSAIIYGGNAEQAQNQFESWLSASPDAERPIHVEIKKIVTARFVDELLTESGNQPLDWPQTAKQIADRLQDTAVDDLEQGYWVDVNQTLPPGKVAPDLESLKRDLPEEIRSGLNWAPDKHFFFLVSALSPQAAPAMYPDESEIPEPSPVPDTDGIASDEGSDLDGYVLALPEMREKEAAALVQARNSVVAAWLWRKYAADTRLTLNEIHVGPCCGLIPVE